MLVSIRKGEDHVPRPSYLLLASRRFSVVGFLISFFLFFTSPSLIHAGNMNLCKNIPGKETTLGIFSKGYDGPAANIPYEKCKDDCGCPDFGSARFFDEIDNYSSVICVENPELVAKYAKQNEKIIDKIIPSGRGRATYNFSFIDSFAIQPKNQQELDVQQLNLLLPALNLPDRFDDSFADSLCVYESKFDRSECAQYLGATKVDGISENMVPTSWFYKRTTSIKSQFEAKKIRLAQIVACMNGSAGELEPCDQNYTVVKATGETARDVAKKYYQISYEEFQQLPQPEQMKILSIRETRASSPVCVVVKRERDPEDMSFWEGLFYHNRLDNQIYYLCGYVPGVSAVREASKTMMQTLSTQAVSTKAIDEVTASLKKPTTGNTTEARLLDKVETAVTNGLSCGTFSPTYQTMGSQAPSRNEGKADISWTFNFLRPNKETLPQPMTFVYSAYLIGPTEMIAQFMGNHPQAAMKNLFTSDATAAIGKQALLPQPLTVTPPTAETPTRLVDINGDYCNDASPGGCIDAKATFTSKVPNRNVQAGLQGGEAVNNILMVGHKIAWPISSPSRWSSMCWANELAQKLGDNAVLAGTPLFTLIGRTIDAVLTNCPAEIIAEPPSSPGDCSGTMGKALTPASGSCKLCNTDTFSQEFYSSGVGNIPPKMQEILESAAAENKVPASVILGIMFAEGGFERPCYNPSENGKWTDEMVCAEEIPNCNTCNVAPSTGARGPFQVIERWFPQSTFGSACNYTDSARTIASNHRTERDGNPCWVRGTTDPYCQSVDPQYQDVIRVGDVYQCGSYTVNMGRSQGGPTCESWTEQDVATVARAFRGTCDQAYISRVVNIWKKYTCK